VCEVLRTSHWRVPRNSEAFPAPQATSKQKTADRPLSKRAAAPLLDFMSGCRAAVVTFVGSGKKRVDRLTPELRLSTAALPWIFLEKKGGPVPSFSLSEHWRRPLLCYLRKNRGSQ